ncbi:MFS transporter [Corynebacterium cystitidis]|uniref:Predicted arabinose efflux permease, MFS family n=1 Tax=Corynebacterium cystitidis DSM 20524 TaxID=1121357 RepID=A0A1H9RXI7_9CORY|nr:MFS transporter [Corynebacterium cystitidis]WJY82122.1 Tetracycline resistance protein, class C [Corynebacterium cystitidis DSM 20524]SER77368.1 Predicted arabinose efflux permease, MFS family [Corynebacterium cystitidis DSM 20524]SNV79004.1 high-affinity glucose transporter [Corynebacterium cystitidis]
MTDNSASNPVKIPVEIWVLVSAAFLIALGYGLIAPIIPQFAVSFGVSMAAAGAVVSVFSAARLVGAPWAGRLVDKLGSRKVYLTGLVVVAVTTGLVAVTQAYWQILVLRTIAGIGSTMFSISAMGMIVKVAPPAIRGRASSVYGTAFLLGNIVGPVAGAAMSFLGMRWPFVIYGVGVGLAAFVVWKAMPRSDHDEKTTTLPPMELKEAMQDSAYRSVLVSNFAQGWINMGVRVAVLPLFAAVVFEHGGAAAGLAMAAFAAGNALALQFSGRLADTIGRKPMILAGLVMSAIFTGGMGFADAFWPLLIVSALAGMGSGLLNPGQQAVLADVIGNQRSGGKVLSTFQMSMDAGQIAGPIIIGALAERFGFTVAFGVCGVLAIVAAIVWLFGRETLPDAGRERKRLVKRGDK